MLMINEDIKIYLYLPAADMRKSIDSLCTLISDQLSFFFIASVNVIIYFVTGQHSEYEKSNSSVKFKFHSGIILSRVPVLAR